MSKGEATPTPGRTSSQTQASAMESGESRLSVLVAGEEHFATFPLPADGAVRIGRAEDNDICLEERTLSRYHAVLHIDDSLAVEDLASANGTFVQNAQIAANVGVEIQLNEAVVLGSVTVIIQKRAMTAPRRLFRSNDYFEERLHDECARCERYGSTFTMIHLRLDRELEAQAIESALTETLRPSDVVGTYGPTQFDLLLLELAAEEAGVVIERMEKALTARGGRPRFGVAVYARDGRTANELAATARSRSRGRERANTEAGRFIIADPAMEKLHDLVKRIAVADITVLLLGETGVGKEVIAELIHASSRRKDGPLLRLNCAALTQSLLESELFGHERGAFTGAQDTKRGLLEVAAGGTVFLDEVGELPLETQAKLLRALEERTVKRVGGLEPISIDVRFIAATNRDLEGEIARGRFRQDLFYRLNGFSVAIPPLRQRIAEIEPLALLFIGNLCKQLDRYPVPEISDDVVELLGSYVWPGNIRELRNVIERAAILCTDEAISAVHLPDKLRGFFATGSSQSSESTPRTTPVPVLKQAFSPDQEKRAIVSALAETGGNQTKAAKLLGISRRTLLSRLDRYGIERPRKGK